MRAERYSYVYLHIIVPSIYTIYLCYPITHTHTQQTHIHIAISLPPSLTLCALACICRVVICIGIVII